ncbi:antitoxin Xre/MbcA/ParS toxin-binding domain-containing protein [Parabacteroides sp. Marseille-P3160]|uniref:type II RES/Xre toxin-antitoxin system antitoxin n=1 Tax=Parabacteroides sp. Marseille-P3160 TaxID=1917887 RepID=UPI0009B999D3|nr:antitoxin Xre/MbcA/ParS toxin-binding domain-containing protein [Parabacteroides sp. Marseille-P3160]
MGTKVKDRNKSFDFSIKDKDIVSLIRSTREGIGFDSFLSIAKNSSINMQEWSAILHFSERSMLRYKKEGKTFDPLQSEKIIQVALILQKGQEVFGDTAKFNNWLDTDNTALGKTKPKDLLDNSFGIQLIENELTKIEHGILS